ncbi:melanization protease 1 [Aedes aegypti]|uniref:Uncharacterized protein n=1 Tax=Aedes aegypti TaxID=7159 RepID=A0A1S4F478_AEDAE|nr:melanization protease 1 [Aedes aegypti]
MSYNKMFEQTTFTVWFALSLVLWLGIRADADGLASDKLKLLPRYCGLSISDRLVGGKYAQLFEYPWIALLQYDHDGEIEHGCSGTLINNRYVLTAAQCLANRTDFQLLNVRLGELDKSQYLDCSVYETGDEAEKDCADPADDYGVETIRIHPEYNHETFQNDIGLIRLNRDVVMHDNTNPICMPIATSVRSATTSKLVGIGWGTCGTQQSSNLLQKSLLTPVDSVECNRALSAGQIEMQVSAAQICATRFTGMDIGGPIGAVMPHSHAGPKFVQVGIASGAVGYCERENVPGVYVRVANYMDWILDTIHA